MIRRDRIVELQSRYIPLFKNEEKRLRSKNNLKNWYHYNPVSFYWKNGSRKRRIKKEMFEYFISNLIYEIICSNQPLPFWKSKFIAWFRFHCSKRQFIWIEWKLKFLKTEEASSLARQTSSTLHFWKNNWGCRVVFYIYIHPKFI